MSSQGRDMAEILSFSQKNMGIHMFSHIMNMFNRRTTTQINDDAVPRHVIFGDLLDLHDLSVELSGADFIASESHLGFNGLGYTRFPPSQVKSYDLTHDDSNASGITFPKPGDTYDGSGLVSSIGTRSHGCGLTDGSSYQIIEDDSILNPTDKISIVGWLYPKAIVSGTQIILEKPNQYRLQLAATNKLQWTIYVSSVAYTVEYTFTADTFIHFAASFGTSGIVKLTINNTLEDSETLASSDTVITEASDTVITEAGDTVVTEGSAIALDTDSQNLTIFGDGTNNLANGNALAWLSILNEDVSAVSGWISNHYTKRIIDTENATEITTIPYIDSLKPMTDAFSGMFIGN